MQVALDFHGTALTGTNSLGELGDGTETAHTSPEINLGGLTNVVQVVQSSTGALAGCQ